MRAQSISMHPCSMEKEGCHFRGNILVHVKFVQAFVIFTSFAVFAALLVEGTSMSSLCRRRCGDLAIEYPFGIDDGCGSLEYRSLLVCTNDTLLQLWTPSGRYRVMNISYAQQYLLLSDPSMWNCSAGNKLPRSQRFSLDISKKFSISLSNTFLYFNCNESFVLVRPQPSYCESQSERCESVCDSNNYLCNNLPVCPKALTKASCCSYYPRTSDSLRLMLDNCESYTSVYWGLTNANASTTTYNQIPSYGIRLDYEVPMSSQCVNCEEHGGICGYDTYFSSFLCLCTHSHKNTTTYCTDHGSHVRKGQVAAGIVGGVGVGGMIAGGAIIWYRRRRRPNRPQRLGALNST